MHAVCAHYVSGGSGGGGSSSSGIKLRRRGSPVSRSAASASAANSPTVTLDDALAQLGEQQRQALAQEWGYTRVGARLPEGITLGVLSQAIPEEAMQLDLKALAVGMALPLALMAAGYAWMAYAHSIIGPLQQAACWLLIGTGYFGLFTAALDAARLALLPGRHGLQSFIGSLLLAPSLYSLEAVRVQLLMHYSQPNVLSDGGSGWEPLTKQRLHAMGRTQRALARLLHTTPLLLFSSIAHWASSWGGLDLKRYYPPMRLAMLGSWSVPAWFAGAVFPCLVASGGFSAWFDCWLMPWLVFHMWASLLTLLQHTAPQVPFDTPGASYDVTRAAVNGTVTVLLPGWLERVLNYANYHLPQHLSGSVPFYHAKAATAALESRLSPFLNVAAVNGRLLRNLMERWQVCLRRVSVFVSVCMCIGRGDTKGH